MRGRRTAKNAMKRNQNNADEDEEGKNGEIAAKEKDDDEEEMDVDEKEEEEQTRYDHQNESAGPREVVANRRRVAIVNRARNSGDRVDEKETSGKDKRGCRSKETTITTTTTTTRTTKEEERLWVMKEENLGRRSSCGRHPFFTLRCSCNELLASIYLTAGDYPKAVLEANELDATVSAYPRTLSSLVAHCEMVR